MARIDNINNFLTDVADSIRTKTGKSNKISASSFDTEIASITTSEDLDSELATYNTELTEQEESLSGIVEYLENKIESGEPLLLQDKSIEITENGTTNVTADEGYDGLNSVEVTTNINTGDSGSGKIAPTSISFSNYTGTEIDLSTLSVENLTTLNSMFSNSTNLIKINLGGLDTSKITNMGYMFRNCSNLIEIQGINNLNLSSATQMTGIFQNCTNLTKLDLNNWNTSNVTYSYQHFVGCSKLTELKVNNWNTSKFTSMSGEFDRCTVLSELDLSGWETSKVTTMSRMFADCNALKRLDIRNFVFDKVTSFANMFYGVPSDCLIIVKDDTAKTWITSNFTTLTNVKTVAELEG